MTTISAIVGWAWKLGIISGAGTWLWNHLTSSKDKRLQYLHDMLEWAVDGMKNRVAAGGSEPATVDAWIDDVLNSVGVVLKARGLAALSPYEDAALRATAKLAHAATSKLGIGNIATK